MLDFLYSISLYPLELAYKYFYVFFSGLTENYGLGLLCLSLLSTVIFNPLKKSASAMQAREMEIQAVMAPQLAAIRKESRGAARQQRTAALYRRYAYHPLMSLRSSVGILLQVPFLCAAYYMLSEYEPIRGQACWIIRDLGKPDGLLGGVNLLPILMTLINIGAVYTTANFSRRDHLQALVVALLFLLLLYAAPAALLVYWTGNNALMLLGNFAPALRRFLSPLRAWKKRAAPLKREKRFILQKTAGLTHYALSLAVFAAIVFCFGLGTMLYSFGPLLKSSLSTLEAGDVTRVLRLLPDMTALGGYVLSALAALIFVLRENAPSWKPGITRALCIAITIPVCAYFYQDIPASYHNDSYAAVRLHFYLSLLLCFSFICITALSHTLAGELPYLNTGNETALFISAAAAIGLITLLLSPLSLYLSSPASFDAPLAGIVRSMVPYVIVFLLLCAVLWILIPKRLRGVAAFVFFVVTLLVMINSSIVTGDYGELDYVRLSKDQNLNSMTLPLLDLFLLWVSFAVIAFFYYFRQVKKLLVFLQLTSILLVLGTGVALLLQKPGNDASRAAGGEIDRLTAAYALSATEPNIVVFVLDMFTGGHVEDIMTQYPALPERFPGFVWYPDTVALGEFTTLSILGIYGGNAFAPDAINARARGFGTEIAEAYAAMPRALSSRGFETAFVNPPYPPDAARFAALTDGMAVDVVPDVPIRKILPRWLEKIHMDPARVSGNDYTNLMFMLSVFKASPHALKKYLYNQGQWKTGYSWSPLYALSHSAFLGLTPDMLSFDSPKPTLKYFYSLMTHYPWFLPRDSLIPVEDPYPDTQGQNIMVNGVKPEHVYIEKHALDIIGNFCDALRRRGVYDNTRIILVSDHCDADSRMLNTALGVNEEGQQSFWRERNAYLGRPHALLMVKDFKATARFQRSPALMSTADVPALVCQGICDPAEFPYPDTGPARVRKHFRNGPWVQMEFPDRTRLVYEGLSTLSGTMFKKENWHNEGAGESTWDSRQQ